MKIYDLSLPISKDSPVFPGTPKMDYTLSHTIKKNSFNLGVASINTHAGTHTDAPLHFLDGAPSLSDVEISKYIGKAFVIDCLNKKAFDPICVEDLLPYKDKIGELKRVIIKTGWSKYYNEDKFFTDYPFITVKLAKWLADKDIVMLGVEAPSLNPSDYIEVHKILLSSGAAVVEGLANLESFAGSEIFFVGVPIAFKGADGFPIRAVAIEF